MSIIRVHYSFATNEKGGALAVMGSPPFVVVLEMSGVYNKKATYREISSLETHGFRFVFSRYAELSLWRAENG